MNISNKIYKYQLKIAQKVFSVYYAIFGAFLVSIIVATKILDKCNGEVNGVDLGAFITIFVLGLCSFKKPFYFSQGNNVSRKSFIIGTIKYGVVMTAILPFINIIISKALSIFTDSPNIFDLIYMLPENFQIYLNPALSDMKLYLLINYIWSFTIGLLIFMTGLTITMIYFRLNKIGQIVVSLIPIMMLIGMDCFGDFNENIGIPVIMKLLGFQPQNPYIGIITFIILSLVAMIIQLSLVRRATINKE